MRTPLPDLTAGAETPATEGGSWPPSRPHRGFLAGLILGSLGLALFATVQNLADETYNVSFSPAGARPGAPRLVMAGVRASF